MVASWRSNGSPPVLVPLSWFTREEKQRSSQETPTQHTTTTNHQARGTTRTTQVTKHAFRGTTSTSNKYPTPQPPTPCPSHNHTN